MSDPINEEQVKQALKEGLKEWMDEQYTKLGKWTAGTLLTLVIAAVTWFILYKNGLDVIK